MLVGPAVQFLHEIDGEFPVIQLADSNPPTLICSLHIFHIHVRVIQSAPYLYECQFLL